MRNKRQTAIGVGSNVRRVLEGELQKQLDAVQAEARALRESFGLTLQRYGRHLSGCPLAEDRAEALCTCDLHNIIARLLPQRAWCAHCGHAFGFHVRTWDNKTYCIGPNAGERCCCQTDPSMNVAMLDAALDRRPPQPLKGDR